MGGLGKTTVIKDIYQNQLSGTFERHAFVIIMRPFNREKLLLSLLTQLSDKKDKVSASTTKKDIAGMSLGNLEVELTSLTKEKSCLIVLDDVSSTAEWDKIIQSLNEMKNTSRIVVTTREMNIAKHCSSRKQENMYELKCLEHKDARELFTKKVFSKNINLNEQYPELGKEADRILKKCSGLPLAVVTVGGFLANQPKTVIEWRKLNENISAELEINPELCPIKTILTKSYDGLPYHLKSCFLYMPIFPEDFKIRRRRLARRWTAEGYSKEAREKSAEEISDGYFTELISRSMILTSQQSVYSIKGIDYCQVHDLMREIAISKSIEENLVFSLNEDCRSNNMGTTRHIAIHGDWKGDQTKFENIVDTSRVRSVTVFGRWKPFFISDKMSMLRVLDLEDTRCLYDHHIKHIGKFFHLRYFSLRGCDTIYHLPDSAGNLRQLETLDIRDTLIVKLPKSIINLEKLTYLCAGWESVHENLSYQEAVGELQVMRKLYCRGAVNHRDVFTALSCNLLTVLAMKLDMHGVVVPRGMRKLKDLRALGVVNVSQEKNVLKDIKELTQLRKLGVTGINKKNSTRLCSTISALSRLESLLLRSEGKPGLYGCLDRMSSPPENLQSLKLYGNLVILPKWIEVLTNLVKLKLRSTKISNEKDTMKILGNLPNLASLHLLGDSFLDEDSCLNFQREVFLNLVVLENSSYNSIKFEEATAPKLELLKFVYQVIDSDTVSGLPCLSGLKEVLLEGEYDPEELEYLGGELAKNRNGPVYRRV